MNLISKIVAGTLLGFGLFVSVGMTIELTDSQSSAEDRKGAIAAFLIFGLPPATLGGWMLWNGHRKSHRAERDRLRSTFFKLLQENEGHITPIRFAMASGLEGGAAKVYLDERAKEFNALFNVTEEGNLVYYFELGGEDPDSPGPHSQP
jgi:hypothetical protein